MEEVSMPHHIFGHLIHSFARDEGVDLAQSFTASGIAHPGDAFGEVFVWCWEADRDLAMRLLAELLVAAQQQSEPGEEELTLDKLLEGMRFGLHRTKYAREEEYYDIRQYAQTEVPTWIEGAAE